MALSVLAYNLTRVINIIGTADGCDRGLRPNQPWLLTDFLGRVFLHGQDPKRTSSQAATDADAARISRRLRLEPKHFPA